MNTFQLTKTYKQSLINCKLYINLNKNYVPNQNKFVQHTYAALNI